MDIMMILMTTTRIMTTYSAVAVCVCKDAVLLFRMKHKPIGAEWYSVLNKCHSFILCYIDLPVEQVHEHQL